MQSDSTKPLLRPAISPAANIRLRIRTCEEFLASPRPEFLVQGLLSATGVTVIFGPANSGKTLFAVDIALSLAEGLPVCGRRTYHAAPVLYIPAEDPESVRDRVEGWMHLHGRKPPRNFMVWEGRLQLNDRSSVDSMADDVDNGVRAGMPRPRAVFIDTLLNTTAGVDPSQASAMTEVFQNLEYLSRKLNACIVVIGHATKGDPKTLLGSAAIRAMIGCEIVIEPNENADGFIVIPQKQRRTKKGGRFTYAIQTVRLEREEYGEPVETAVGVFAGVPDRQCIPVPQKPRKANPKGAANEKVLLDFLCEAGPNGLAREEWFNLAKAAGLLGGAKPKRSFDAAYGNLKMIGHIEERNGRWVPTRL